MLQKSIENFQSIFTIYYSIHIEKKLKSYIYSICQIAQTKNRKSYLNKIKNDDYLGFRQKVTSHNFQRKKFIEYKIFKKFK